MRSVCVLYEDQAGEQIENFGLHRLVVQCVLDGSTVDDSLATRRALKPIVCKGNGNVRRKCQQELDRLAAGGPVIAVYDRDKIRDFADLRALIPVGAKHPCNGPARDALTGGRSPDQLCVILLEENTETLLQAIQHITPDLVSAEIYARALEKTARGRGREARDRILNAAARAEHRELRDRLRDRVPSFARLIRKVIGALG